MKTYEFPYGGSTGKNDTWDSSICFDLTDEESERLEESARKEPRWRLDEDEAISDICEKIEHFIFEENKRMMIEDGRMPTRRRFCVLSKSYELAVASKLLFMED
ncbi:MAG: hypothetical protein IKE24_03635 [Clostridia bacterium]|nr:hypothetical protein [Clostridia bacterium]